jgi:nicotinamidase-related amidase
MSLFKRKDQKTEHNAEPATGRHPAILTCKETGLVIIDVQEKFIPVIVNLNMAVENMTRLVLAFQMYKMPVLVTEQYPKGLGKTLPIIRNLFENFEVTEKTAFSCCGEPQFMEKVRGLGLKTLVVAGLETHVCVCQTVLDLLHLGFNVHVITDAVCSRHQHDFGTALRKMEKAGAILDTTEMALFELTEKAGTDTFRIISRLVKGRLKGPKGQVQQTEPLKKAKEGAGEVKVTSPAGVKKPAAAEETTPLEVTEKAKNEKKPDGVKDVVKEAVVTKEKPAPVKEPEKVVKVDGPADKGSVAKQEKPAAENIKENVKAESKDGKTEDVKKEPDVIEIVKEAETDISSEELGIDLSEIDKILSEEKKKDNKQK